MLKDRKEDISLIADFSKDGYTLVVYYDKSADLFYVGIVKDKKRYKDIFTQIVLKKDDINNIIEWLKIFENTSKLNRLCCFCVSLCEILTFIKLDDDTVYIQLYQQASFPRQRVGNTRDDFYLTKEEAGVLGRTLSVFLKTELNQKSSLLEQHCEKLEK